MRRGFTVTELVVVIGIMIALAGVGIPIFTGMKSTAESAKCITRLRGLGTALESYHVVLSFRTRTHDHISHGFQDCPCRHQALR